MDLAAPVPARVVHLPRGVVALVATALVVGSLVVGYGAMRTPVILVTGGQTRQVQTHRDTVFGLLLDLGIPVGDEDVVLYNGADVTRELDTPLEPGARVTVERARLVLVTTDGQSVGFSTFARSLDTVLEEARVSVGPHDSVQVEGDLSAEMGDQPAHIIVQRAIPLTLVENGQMTILHTTAATVGEALDREGITLYLADGVTPDLGEPVTEGLVVNIDRSTPVSVPCDG